MPASTMAQASRGVNTYLAGVQRNKLQRHSGCRVCNGGCGDKGLREAPCYNCRLKQMAQAATGILTSPKASYRDAAPGLLLNNDFTITFLGTSAASFSPCSSTSACLIRVGRTAIMVDAGVGALRQLQKTGMSADALDAVLMTHWHLDHCAGLRGLINSRTCSSPLSVLGPEPSGPARLLLRAICPAALRSFESVRGGRAFRISDIQAEPIDTVHSTASVGWRLTEASSMNRRMVISGDTRPTEAIIEAAMRADLLVHEATYMEHHSDRAVRRCHSTASEAAGLALKSEVGGLALTHTSSRYSVEMIGMEAEAVFPGVFVAAPLSSMVIGRLSDESKRMGCGWGQLAVQAGIAG